MTIPRYRYKADYIGDGELRHPTGRVEKVHYVINHYLELETATRETPQGQDLLTGRIRSLERLATVEQWAFRDDARWGTVFTLILSMHSVQLPVRLQADGQIIPAGDLIACS